MHHIRRHMLKVLSRTKFARFRDMKPPSVDSNVYSYHLKEMQKDGYIHKTAQGYTLAAKGLQYVDGLRADDFKPRETPKPIVILALKNRRGEWLLAERKIQPYIGTLMFPSGTQHRGDSPLETAERKLREKTGYQDLTKTYRGIADIQIKTEIHELITHVIATIYEATLPSDETPPETDRFRYLWAGATAYDVSIMGGNQELSQVLSQPGVFNVAIVGTAAL